jgi:hypothetical protein
VGFGQLGNWNIKKLVKVEHVIGKVEHWKTGKLEIGELEIAM